MILEDIMCDIKDRIEGTGYFSTIYELAEMTKLVSEDGVREYPRYYIGKGQYKDLYNLDANVGYIRKRSDVDLNELKDFAQSCDSELMELLYPMRFVGGVKKEILGDDAYSDDKLVYETLEVLGGRVTNISNTRKVYVKPERYETDRNKVWSEEVRGIEVIINPKLVYLYIDFELSIEIKRSCLIPDCYG